MPNQRAPNWAAIGFRTGLDWTGQDKPGQDRAKQARGLANGLASGELPAVSAGSTPFSAAAPSRRNSADFKLPLAVEFASGVPIAVKHQRKPQASNSAAPQTSNTITATDNQVPCNLVILPTLSSIIALITLFRIAFEKPSYQAPPADAQIEVNDLKDYLASRYHPVRRGRVLDDRYQIVVYGLAGARSAARAVISII
ncbi:protein kinase domain protein [Ophiostoma piceae UAMH 11346]|uniref:Protein kinase domain protein n=1 Tax=Ophiostoma piceae (strain UAMH 11346) TaxID=1262450 RepID=S3CEN1_OPHP1|nr:protein kinase domain protein [Ophiostoma piceae UAMH 11346]